MKKITAILLAATMIVSLSACGSKTEAVNTENTQTVVESTETTENVQDAASGETSEETQFSKDETVTDIAETDTAKSEMITSFSINVDGVTTTDELEVRIEEHLASLIDSLNLRKEALFTEIDTYEKYCESDAVSKFYETVIDETNQMCIMLYEYSAYYARMILDSDMENDDKYDAIKGINNCLYEDACDEINDEIYEGIMDDMSDYFYEGIIDDAQEEVNYSKWYDTASEEYSEWYDTTSEVYSIYYDAAGDIYSFYYDMSAELYSGDMERAEKIYEKFVQDIEKAKSNGSGDAMISDAIYDTTVREAASIEELETTVETHVLECIAALNKEWEELAAEIDTFEKYVENADKVEAFHVRVEEASAEILTMICQYGVEYSELIIQSDASAGDMYDDFEGFSDCIYDDACELVHDEIYDTLLEDIKDYYYDGIINDAKDDVAYGDWSDARSDAYGWWSDARSEVYGNWSDTRGDLYSFWSDMRGDLYSKEIEDAKETVTKFQEKISK